MPGEKYSPLLLVFISYLRPVSWLVSWTTAPVIGFPSRSLHTPFTVPVDWAKAGVVHNAAASATSIRTANFCFILASALNLVTILNFSRRLLWVKRNKKRKFRSSSLGQF